MVEDLQTQMAQLEEKVNQSVNESITKTLTDLTDGETTSISSTSQAIVNNKLSSLMDAVKTAILRVVQDDSDGSNYYWEDGKFYQDKLNASVPNNAVAITTTLWNDWSAQQDNVDERDVVSRMSGQILIKKYPFTSSDGRKLYYVEYLVTTETPHRKKLFYFIPA